MTRQDLEAIAASASSSAGPTALPGQSNAVFVALTRDECRCDDWELSIDDAHVRMIEAERFPELFELPKTRWCGSCTNVATSRPAIDGPAIDHTAAQRLRDGREDQMMPVATDDQEDILNTNK